MIPPDDIYYEYDTLLGKADELNDKLLSSLKIGKSPRRLDCKIENLKSLNQELSKGLERALDSLKRVDQDLATEL